MSCEDLNKIMQYMYIYIVYIIYMCVCVSVLFQECNQFVFIEGSLEVKLPTIWTDEAAEVGRVREEKGRKNKIREEKSQ